MDVYEVRKVGRSEVVDGLECVEEDFKDDAVLNWKPMKVL